MDIRTIELQNQQVNYESNFSVSISFYKILLTKPQTRLYFFNPLISDVTPIPCISLFKQDFLSPPTQSYLRKLIPYLYQRGVLLLEIL